MKICEIQKSKKKNFNNHLHYSPTTFPSTFTQQLQYLLGPATYQTLLWAFWRHPWANEIKKTFLLFYNFYSISRERQQAMIWTSKLCVFVTKRWVRSSKEQSRVRPLEVQGGRGWEWLQFQLGSPGGLDWECSVTKLRSYCFVGFPATCIRWYSPCQ